ncbi:DNA repair protein RAD51 homolog 4 isoform X3 [Prosopis cineraria]|uniref:DNA repair protein RAD51 homolog 4 isoform X3 n=1 Tax=Prosopis cineraria TaxID=364024 RepID=UPI00240EB75C|nr:DNA repair protein RAD51 homolog 4 isoform X3 [Prosopis cineraria]
MAPLKSLQQEYPLVDSSFQAFCASHGIFSVEDFLLYDVDVLISSADKQSTSQRLKQGINQLLYIIDALHQPLLTGLDLLEDAKRNKHSLSTGCQGYHWIDVLLGGGLRQGQLTELVGPSSSGKTQFAATVAKKHLAFVVYLDTCNAFSPQCIAHFVGRSSSPVFNDQADHKPLQKVLDRIICYPVFDIFQMFDVLHQLEINLRSEMFKSDCQVRLLIVDSVSSLITPILGGGGPQGHALMISVGFLLKKLAHEHNLAVLVTNHVVGGDSGTCKPALGESWKTVPHVRILLSRECESDICTFSILKHPSMASGRAASEMHAHDLVSGLSSSP